MAAADPGRRRPDVEMSAVVKAKRLRFARTTDVDVEFSGDSDGEQSSGSEGENLPDDVEPGVTYRDVRVWWRAATSVRSGARARMK
jgi:hypothetical protein